MGEKDKMSLKDMYVRISKCRDFEISNVWIRGVFLTAFLIGSFTAYGFICVKFLSDKCELQYSTCVNWAAFVVTVIGMFVSAIWVMMAKASKAWYEIYEDVIDNFVHAFPDGFEFNGDDEQLLYECKLKRLRKRWEYKQGTDAPIGRMKPTDQRLWSLVGGAYSPSRINIVIGQFSLFIWIVLSAIHVAFAMLQVGCKEFVANVFAIIHMIQKSNHLIMVVVFIVAAVFVFFILPNLIKTRDE